MPDDDVEPVTSEANRRRRSGDDAAAAAGVDARGSVAGAGATRASWRRPGLGSAVGATFGVVYAVSHAWWTITGPLSFVRVESVFVGGWAVVIVAVVAALICTGSGGGVVGSWPSPARWLWCGVGWLTAAALAAYGLLLWPRLAALLLIPFGVSVTADDLGALLLQALATLTAVLTAVSTLPILRELRHRCADCGRRHGRSPEDRREPTRWWGWAGGYLAILGLAIRIAPEVPGWIRDGVVRPDSPGGSGFIVFLVLMLLAGTLLPLALVHRWGRYWPRWVLPWAGRQIPRWLVLGPAAMMSIGLLAYFGIGGTTAMILGLTSGELIEAVEITGYALWGLGLGIAALSYGGLTKPGCPRGVEGSSLVFDGN